MKPSLLRRLPDIAMLARQRARELDPRGHTPVPAGGHPHVLEPRDGAPAQVMLLGGDELSVMVGLLGGRTRLGPMAGRLRLVWLQEVAMPSLDMQDAPLNWGQRETRRLIELTTLFYLARELLCESGSLVTSVADTRDRCVERLLGTVFGQVRRWHERQRDWSARLVANHSEKRLLRALTGAAGRPSSIDLMQQLSQDGDPVLVVQADGPFAAMTTALPRQWILAQSQPLSMALLREHLKAEQLRSGAVWHPQEPERRWVVLS